MFLTKCVLPLNQQNCDKETNKQIKITPYPLTIYLYTRIFTRRTLNYTGLMKRECKQLWLAIPQIKKCKKQKTNNHLSYQR